MKQPHPQIGDKVGLMPTDGQWEPELTLAIISAEILNKRKFYRVKEIDGALFLRESLFVKEDGALQVLKQCTCGHMWMGRMKDEPCPSCNPREIS